jgi:hypothetical protein
MDNIGRSIIFYGLYNFIMLQQVPGWQLSKEDNGCLKLSRSWKAKTFLKGLEFFKVIGGVAEAEGENLIFFHCSMLFCIIVWLKKKSNVRIII